MNRIESAAGSQLAELEFAPGEQVVACTPYAVELGLAGLALATYGATYYACRAFGQHYAKTEKITAAPERALSSSDLVDVRIGALGNEYYKTI